MDRSDASSMNWISNLDQRVTRLEERSDHVVDDLRRLEVSIKELTATLTAHIQIVDAKVDRFSSQVIALLVAVLVGVVIEGLRFALDFAGKGP